MTFDKLQNAWANEQNQPTSWPTDPLTPGKGGSLFDAIRKSMRREFANQVAGYIVLFVLYLYFRRTALSSAVVTTIALILFLQAIYFFTRFYRFYRRTQRFDLSLKRNLRRLTKELEVNLEIYRTFTLCAAPLATLAGIFVFAGPAVTAALRFVLVNGFAPGWQVVLWYYANLVIFSVVVALILNWQLRWQYRRPLRELNRLLDDLDAA